MDEVNEENFFLLLRTFQFYWRRFLAFPRTHELLPGIWPLKYMEKGMPSNENVSKNTFSVHPRGSYKVQISAKRAMWNWGHLRVWKMKGRSGEWVASVLWMNHSLQNILCSLSMDIRNPYMSCTSIKFCKDPTNYSFMRELNTDSPGTLGFNPQ